MYGSHYFGQGYFAEGTIDWTYVVYGRGTAQVVAGGQARRPGRVSLPAFVPEELVATALVAALRPVVDRGRPRLRSGLVLLPRGSPAAGGGGLLASGGLSVSRPTGDPRYVRGRVWLPVAPWLPGLSTVLATTGRVRVEWFYPSIVRPPAKAPTGFHVYIGTGGTPDYSTPAATVPFSAAIAGTFGVNLTGLTDDTTYTIGVRAYNATAEEPNTNTVTVTADVVGPDAVDDLVGVAVAG
jgi:hypothetical protein